MIKESKLEGIGGWMILPIIGFFGNLIIIIFEVFDLLLNYYFEEVYYFISLDLLVGSFYLIALIMIFQKKEEARKWAIVALSITLILSLVDFISYGESMIPMLGAIIWITYFYKSERVKNTFVN